MLEKIKRHKLRTVLIIFGVALLCGVFVIARPDTYLPHKRIVLHAPYSLSDVPIRLIPMGEKIYHPNAPLGHPGIDFQWASPDSKVLASADGVINSIRLVTDKWPKWEIDVNSWPYVIRYKEMETYNTALKPASISKQATFWATRLTPSCTISREPTRYIGNSPHQA